MNRRGIEFSLVPVEPGLWKWQFRIGETVTTGKSETNLKGLAAHRVQQRLDRELKKRAHDFLPVGSDSGAWAASRRARGNSARDRETAAALAPWSERLDLPQRVPCRPL